MRKVKTHVTVYYNSTDAEKAWQKRLQNRDYRKGTAWDPGLGISYYMYLRFGTLFSGVMG